MCGRALERVLGGGLVQGSYEFDVTNGFCTVSPGRIHLLGVGGGVGGEEGGKGWVSGR